MKSQLLDDQQISILIEDLLETYGYDFTGYSKASLKRRINRIYATDPSKSFSEFRAMIGANPNNLHHFVRQVTVNVTEMFRDPLFFRALQEQVFPVLATYPFIRIWHAGCSTGEEVYSMAILLKEANLLQKTLLYATDINEEVVAKAAAGIIPINHMKTYSENYIKAGGKEAFSDYYTAGYDHIIFDQDLKKQMVFATHNLASDGSFNQFQLILCRNVLIYFDKELQVKVLHLFDQSLEKLGFLALGSKETLKLSNHNERYQQLSKEKIWRKIG